MLLLNGELKVDLALHGIRYPELLLISSASPRLFTTAYVFAEESA